MTSAYEIGSYNRIQRRRRVAAPVASLATALAAIVLDAASLPLWLGFVVALVSTLAWSRWAS